MLRVKTPEDHEKITRELTGPPLVDRPIFVDEQAGFTPPSWWRGDEYASQSSLAATMTMKRN